MCDIDIHLGVGYWNRKAVCRGLCHARSIVTKSTALRFATADDFATILLPSHTLRAALGKSAWQNCQFLGKGCGEEHHVSHRVPRISVIYGRN